MIPDWSQNKLVEFARKQGWSFPTMWIWLLYPRLFRALLLLDSRGFTIAFDKARYISISKPAVG